MLVVTLICYAVLICLGRNKLLSIIELAEKNTININAIKKQL